METSRNFKVLFVISFKVSFKNEFISSLWLKKQYNIKICLNKHFQANEESDKKTVEFYYQLANISMFKQDTKVLKDIVQRLLKCYTPLSVRINRNLLQTEEAGESVHNEKSRSDFISVRPVKHSVLHQM